MKNVSTENISATTGLPELDFATAGGVTELCRRYKAVVVALYPTTDAAHAVAERLIAQKVPVEDISLLVSEGQLRKSLESGACIIPDAEVRGVRHHGAVYGAFAGGAGGLVLGAEALLLGVAAIAALPMIAGVTLIGAVVGGATGAVFSEMDVRLEGTEYRMHLHNGGVLLAAYAPDPASADRIEHLLRDTGAVEVGRHTVAAPAWEVGKSLLDRP